MNYKTPPWLAFLIGIGIFILAKYVGSLPETVYGDSVTETLPWLSHAILKTVLIVIALAGSYIVTRGALGLHGYRRAKKPYIWSSLWPGLVIGAVATTLVVFSPAKGMNLARLGSGLVVLVSILYSSISEEIFTRGFIQSLMGHLRERKFKFLVTRVSIPSLTSGLLFGSMHLALYFSGTDIWTTVIVVSSTFLLGVAAGHMFEKTGSIIPAIVVHLGYNIGGFMAGIISNLILFFITGKLPTPAG